MPDRDGDLSRSHAFDRIRVCFQKRGTHERSAAFYDACRHEPACYHDDRIRAFPNTIISAFIDNVETIEYGTIFLRPLALSQPFLVLDFIGVGVFQAIGNGKISLFMALARKALFEIPLMFVLNSVFGFYGLGFCQLGAEACMAMIAIICLARFLHRFEQEQVLSFE